MSAIIYPVILAVPPSARELPARERGQFLSRHARLALRLSAERLNISLGPLEKDARGAPLAFHDNFWSVTHKPHYVAGVVAPFRVGIDLEAIRPCREALFRKTAGADEWALAEGDDREVMFFRFWTAKEAVLKTGAEGIKDLGRCRILRLESATRLLAEYAGKAWPVEQLLFDGHVASVTSLVPQVEWVRPD